MSEIITTLHKKDDPTVDVYPNIKHENIPSLTITDDKIANNAIITNKLSDNSVTNPKIANRAITEAKIDFMAITTTRLANECVTNMKVKDGEISSEKLNFRLYEHIYNCQCSSPSTNFVIKFTSTHIPFTSSLELFEYLHTTYGMDAPVAINKNGNLSDIFGYVNGSNVLEFTDDNLETYDCAAANTSITSYSHLLF